MKLACTYNEKNLHDNYNQQVSTAFIEIDNH